jgi:predicted ribosome quality control (RQC) complex YloA/Tae2 family protein
VTLRASEVCALAAELAPRLVGSHIQGVRVPSPDAVVLSLRAPGETIHLLVDVTPGAAAFHTIERPPANPAAAFTIQGLLRKELRGRVRSLGPRDGGRGLEIVVEAGEERRTLRWSGGASGTLALWAGTSLLGGIREGKTGPGAPAGPDRLEEPRDLDARRRFTLLRAEAEVDAVRRALGRHLRSRRKAAARLLRKRQEEADRGEEESSLRIEADLLQGNFHRLSRGMEEIEVSDWNASGAPRTIQLDPALSPASQVERRYHRARRAGRAAAEAENRLPEAEAGIELITGALARLAMATSTDEVAEVRNGLPQKLRPKTQVRTRIREQRAEPWRTYVTATGTKILAGRGAKENDELTLRHANGNDIWLHVRGRSGAHVVISRPGPAPSPALLRLGAQVAMAHSGIPDGEAADVTWTRVKFVNKKKGMPPGKVLVTQERVLYLRGDRSVFDQLTRP